MKAFMIKLDNRWVDYRTPGAVNLKKAQSFFSKTYMVKRLWNGGRHVLGELETDGRRFFLKLATSKGISVVMGREAEWNDAVNRVIDPTTSPVWVPMNYEKGQWNGLFYLITEYFDGHLLVQYPMTTDTTTLEDRLDVVIDAALAIQRLSILPGLSPPEVEDGFLKKSKSWLEAIPVDIRRQYTLERLWSIVESGAPRLKKAPQHGDFTPWHIICLSNGKLGLIDGEHARFNGVKAYDLGYMIQRIFSVLGDKSLAKRMYQSVVNRGIDQRNLKTILAARAIGGFLDELVSPTPNFDRAGKFQEWVKEMTP